ncbi:hypothetical protein AVEN_196913-1 [Araneus ventricosus]|uniref:Uncharacterized protein n=1 Tax=Araneus ventricosus TaxID=182803 RepID=A0A4Y2GCI1_ARAVE|nr:hypothetical protein AVEN_196913-1 [Araneus ventricosus]
MDRTGTLLWAVFMYSQRGIQLCRVYAVVLGHPVDITLLDFCQVIVFGDPLLAQDIPRYLHDIIRYSEYRTITWRYRSNIVEHLVLIE